MQRELGHSRLSRRRRRLEALAARHLSGLHGPGGDAAALWARSLIGWRRIGGARPNDAHRALARLEAIGKSEILLTQNVDRLHQAAGGAAVIDLHGRIDHVRCMGCDRVSSRASAARTLSNG